MSEPSLYSEKEVTVNDAREHGLTPEEFEAIQRHLGGRLPTVTELGMYSGLWSEHCSYKNSILQLKTLPTESPRALSKAGEENAGALDIGQGLAVVFKIESHNHPTAVEPYQGAATGVGGIMRDIFTMGARPLCSLNSLRFGPPDQPRNRYLLSGAVKGIGDYGNSLGIPVSGGEIFFDESFTRNCLVNAMTVGVARHDRMTFAKAEGVGNPVFIVGATTGRDGIHGASFASQDLSEESESKRSAVQVGDPFMEKLLMEATLELATSGAVVGIQDMGAAGISCSTTEMSAKGAVGMRVDLDKVPLRESGMNAYEIMLSESQERMLVVAQKGREDELIRIFEKWELAAVQVGEVVDDGLIHIYRDGKYCASAPAESFVLGGGAPRYEREQRRPAYLDEVRKFQVKDLPERSAPEELRADLLQLLASSNICSRRPVYEQYDSEVGLSKVIGPGGDGGLARVPDTDLALAVATDCNSRYCYLDPYVGTAQAVCEGARNVAATGARPIGVTNCLNFGNPHVPENYYVFAECIRGMREACLAFGIPVTGGNVSFYNESQDGPVFPTPTIGMVGLLEDVHKVIRPVTRAPGRTVYLAGAFRPTFGGSEYLMQRSGRAEGAPPELDFDHERALCEFLARASENGAAEAAHDLSLGGLAVGLFRLLYDFEHRAFNGFAVEAAGVEALRGEAGLAGARADLFWFGETNGCALIVAKDGQDAALQKLAGEQGAPLRALGQTTGAGPDASLKLGGGFVVAAADAVRAFDGAESALAKAFGAEMAQDR